MPLFAGRKARMANMLLVVFWPLLFPCAGAHVGGLQPVVGADLHCGDWVCWMLDSWEAARRAGRKQNYFLLDDLPVPEESLWGKTKRNGRDEAYMHMLGVNKCSFKTLSRRFAPLFWHEVGVRKPKSSSRGRKRKSNAEDVLALTLAYLKDGVVQKHFQGHFGAGSSNVQRSLELGLVVLSRTLSTMPSARVEWPDQDKMQEYVDMILHRHPDLRGRRVFGFVDGLNLEIEDPSDPLQQNSYYNAWLGAPHSAMLPLYNPAR